MKITLELEVSDQNGDVESITLNGEPISAIERVEPAFADPLYAVRTRRWVIQPGAISITQAALVKKEEIS